MHHRLTNADVRHEHTQLPDGFYGFPFGVCPWCSGEEGVAADRHVRHPGKCPVWRLEFNEHGGIHRKIRIGPDFVRLGDL